MLGSTLQLRRGRHILRDMGEFEITRFLGRLFPEEPLLLYWHSGTGNFILGLWDNNDAGRIWEVFNLGDNPEAQRRADVQNLISCLKAPIQAGNVLAMLHESDYRCNREREEFGETMARLEGM